MATLTNGYAFDPTEEVTAAKLHTLVTSATCTGIVAADITDSTITSGKISSVSGSSFVSLANIPSGAGKIPEANLPTTFTATLLAALYPVGIVLTFGVSTNPNTLFGFGTWTAIAGKVIVGINSGDTEFDTLDETGGAKTVTLTSAQSGLVAHSHTAPGYAGVGAVTTHFSNNTTDVTPSSTIDSTNACSAANAAESHTNLQPYIVKYVWQRTA
jgi:hypothetical protein